MSGRAASRGLLVLVATAATVVLPGAPAAASCAEVDPYTSAVLFLGTAEETRNGFTPFRVDEVWAGADLAPRVWMRTGQQQLDDEYVVFSATDAHPQPGEQYVVGADEYFDASDCTIYPAGSVAPPTETRTPVPGGSTGTEPYDAPRTEGSEAWWAVAVTVVVALGGALAVLLRRRRGWAAAGRR